MRAKALGAGGEIEVTLHAAKAPALLLEPAQERLLMTPAARFGGGDQVVDVKATTPGKAGGDGKAGCGKRLLARGQEGTEQPVPVRAQYAIHIAHESLLVPVGRMRLAHRLVGKTGRAGFKLTDLGGSVAGTGLKCLTGAPPLWT